MDEDDDFPVIMPTLMSAKTKLKTFNFANNMYKIITGEGQPKSKVSDESEESNDTPFPTCVIVKPAQKPAVEEKKDLVKVGKSVKRSRENDDDDHVEQELNNAQKRNSKKKKTTTDAEQETSTHSTATKTKKQSENENTDTIKSTETKKSADDLNNNENKIPQTGGKHDQSTADVTKNVKSKTTTTQRVLKSKNLNENYRKIDIRKKHFGGKNSKFLSKGAKFKRKQWSKNSRKFGVRFGYNINDDQDDGCLNRNLIRDPSEIQIKKQEKKEEKIDEMSNEAIFRRLAKEEKMRRNQDEKTGKQEKKKSSKNTQISNQEKDEHDSEETTKQVDVEKTVLDEEAD